MENVAFAIFWLLLLALYFLPAIIAHRRRLRGAVAITFLNFFFGWTGIGWIIALIWSLWREKPLPEPVTPRRARISVFLKAVMIGLMLMPFGCPYIVTGSLAREASRLIPLLESYKAQYGTYPERLEDLGVPLKHNDRGLWGIRYGPMEDRKDFWLSCFSATPSPFQLRRVYHSKTRTWEIID